MTENFFDEQSEQSQIKAAIVADYFWAWASVIIAAQDRYPRHTQKIAYIDLFAGPGRYQNGAASTPLMIIERAVGDPKIRNRLVAVFNDKDVANTRSLEAEINKILGIEQLKFKPEISTGEVGEKLIQGFQRAKLIPTFLFVDHSDTRAFPFSSCNRSSSTGDATVFSSSTTTASAWAWAM